jgi:capsular exopolysaccharide synthesis family protein
LEFQIMARVFDALQREQKRKKREGAHDPLAQSIVVDIEAQRPDELAEFDPATPIGTPSGPRSNEGMLLPGATRPLNDLAEVAPAPAVPRITAPAALPALPGGASAAISAPAPASSAPAPAASSPQQYHPPQPSEPPPVAVTSVRLGEVHARLLMLHEPRATGCEQYRTLRTQLFHAAERELTQVIVVTSATAGEGKTATTLNLALAIAQSPNRRVLVIDGDLRRPDVAKYLAQKPFSGFAEVLNDKTGLFDAITRLADHELYLLPVRHNTANPTELLSGKRFQETLHELRQHFDFILIDSPPVKPYADTQLLANHADAVLFVVRFGFASYEVVEEAVQALADQRVLGVVLNGTEARQGSDSDAEYQIQNGHNAPPSPLWSALGPWVRDSWLGRKFKL